MNKTRLGLAALILMLMGALAQLPRRAHADGPDCNVRAFPLDNRRPVDLGIYGPYTPYGGSPNGKYFVGQVMVKGNPQPFLVNDGVFSLITKGFGLVGAANGVNDGGDIAGWGMDAQGNKHAYIILNPEGKTIDLGVEVSSWIMANGVSRCRHVAVNPEQAYYWNHIKGTQALYTPANRIFGHSFAITDTIVVGEIGLPDQFGGGESGAYWTLGKAFRVGTIGEI